jgi:predicted nucleic acid-binding protein
VYWGALLDPRDPWRRGAISVTGKLAQVTLLTTQEVLVETLNLMSGRGPILRAAAVEWCDCVLAETGVILRPQSPSSFEAGLALYRRRLDKGYSLVDCISMTTMKSEGIDDILTNDTHFRQEGFNILLHA